MQAVPEPQTRMTADDFIAWSLERPEGERYELANGVVLRMASERLHHAFVKGRVFLALTRAAEAAGLRCDIMPDGMAVRIDDRTVYEPDAALRVGPRLDLDVTSYDDPLVVVEILSPSTKALDAGTKLTDYFRLPTLRHYLIVRIDRPTVVHHVRASDGTLQTRIVAAGEIRLDPPGISLAVSAFFPEDVKTTP
jgi:Uma2 family endonuclease